MAIGAVLGVLGGRVLGLLHPRGATLLLLLAGVLYGVTSLVGGSGFLAVFIAGLLIGDTERIAERQAYASVAAVGEVVVFVALGVTIGITDLPFQTWRDGIVLALVIGVVARPLAVAVTLARADLSGRERLFVTWAGLKGAVPILLAAFAVIGGVRGAQPLYGVVFVVVAINVLVQGTLVPWVASRLDVAA
jgi:cell volume regulation protein A